MSVKAVFGIINNDSKDISNVTSSYTNVASSVDALKLNNSSVPKIATFENEHWLLDGSYNMFITSESNKLKNGWWSDTQTDWAGDFIGDLPRILISFPNPITSIGITLIFGSENIGKKIEVQWWLEGNLVSQTQELNNLNQVYSLNNHVASYDALSILFYSTVLPYRFIKVARIDYGIGKEFVNEDITTLSCNFNTDLTSKEIKVSSLCMGVYSEEAEFSILNPRGVYLSLKERQKIDIYINKELYSRFYLKNWYSVDDYNYTFECDNVIGMLNDVIFNGGMYNNYNVVNLINEICAEIGFEVEYRDNNINSKTVSGWIGVCSCREALKQVLFASGNILIPRSTEDKIIIGVAGNNLLSSEITKEDMYLGNKMLLKNVITCISIQTHEYMLSNELETIYSSNLNLGVNVVKFNNPYNNISISVDVGTCSIINSNCNYVEFELSDNAHVTIVGKKYIDNNTIVQRIISNDKENTLEIRDAYMVSKSNVESIIDILEWYHTKRIERDICYDYTMNGDVGDKIWVDNIFNLQNNCIIEKMNIDLTTSVSNIKVVVNE